MVFFVIQIGLIRQRHRRRLKIKLKNVNFLGLLLLITGTMAKENKGVIIKL
jgi:hypothetical protein